jgi:mono/diheme cytochrome c family protein
MTLKLALLLFAAAGLDAAPIAADSARGALLFESLSCIECHSINGKGGTVGPDLGRKIDRSFTPATLAATMWNHAPTMWTAMRERNIRPGDLNPQAAADLFAYFYSARFFEKPGDAARGKRLFESKHCADCHGLIQAKPQATAAKLPAAPPVSQWESIGQPIALADAMWNHGATMREEFSKRNLKWAELTTQNLTDLLVYLRNLPQTRNAVTRVEISAGAEGEALFRSKGCERCHTGNLALSGQLKGKTLTDVAAAMWNHEPRMAASPPQLAVAEMREITSYLWASQFFEDAGDAAAGRRVFTSKRCVVCHEDPSSGAPRIGGGTFSGVAMVSALWHHGPRMLDGMKAKKISWPRFEGSQMSDLIAFLSSDSGRKP